MSRQETIAIVVATVLALQFDDKLLQLSGLPSIGTSATLLFLRELVAFLIVFVPVYSIIMHLQRRRQSSQQ